MSIAELSQWLQLAKGTIYNWVYQRRLPFVKVGRALRFDPKEIERVLSNSTKLEKADRGRRS